MTLSCTAERFDGPSSPVEEPLQGQWFGEQISFVLEGRQLHTWFATEISCSGESCGEDLLNVDERKAALEGGEFTIPLGPLLVSGTFVADGHVKGQWSFKSEGCCESTGPWEAFHETWHEDQGPPDSGEDDDM